MESIYPGSDTVEKLNQVIRVLNTVPDEKFDLGVFFAVPTEDEDVCGTAGCAAGWSGADPWFIERGFCLGEPTIDPFDGSWHRSVVYDDHEDFAAIRKFFGLSYTEADYIFFPEYSYELEFGTTSPKPKQVAKRIADFIASGGKMPYGYAARHSSVG